MHIPEIGLKSLASLSVCGVFLCLSDVSATVGTAGDAVAPPISVSTGTPPRVWLAQSELTPAERRDRARRAEAERQHQQSRQSAPQRESAVPQGAEVQDELSKIKAALERISALKTLKLADLQKGQDGYRASLGTKALAVAIFPAGKAVGNPAAATLGEAPKPDDRQRPPETIETRQQGQSAAPPTREELRERTRRAIEARRQQQRNVAPPVREDRQEATAHTDDRGQAGLQQSRPSGSQAPAAAMANLQQGHRPGLRTQAAADGKWNLAFSRGPFSFVDLANGHFGILDGVHLKSMSLVVAAADNEIPIADLPKALQPLMNPFANKQGVLALKQGVNFFGEIEEFSGILQQFQQAFGLKRGPIRIDGVVGGDFIRHFADGNAATTAQDIDEIRMGIGLPGISPPELQGIVDSGPLSLRFQATNGKIEGSGTAAVQIRLSDRSVTVNTSVSFDDAPAIGRNFVSMSGRVPKPDELLPRFPHLDVTGLGVDFGIARLKDDKSEARFGLAGAASFKRKPVKLAGKLVHVDEKRTSVELAISSDQLSFADLVPASVDLPGLDAIAISEVRLRNDFLSVKARFRNEDTTVYIFTPPARRLPAILVVHDEFKFSDYVPILKGTPLDDLGRVENAMFLYVPKDGAADKDPSGSLALSDLPAPVIPKFSVGRSASARIALKPGLNFFGHLDVQAAGAAKTLWQKIGLDGAKHPRLPLSGVVDPAILRPTKEQAKQIVVQIIESIDIAAPLPELKVPTLPGGTDIKNAVFSLKGGKDPTQPDHPRVAVGIKGDIVLVIGGTRLDLTGGLELDKTAGASAEVVKFAASAKRDWDHPLGLNWLSLKEIDLEGDFEESPEKSKNLDFKIAAKASINKKPPVKAEGELVVADGKLDDVILRLAGLSLAEVVPTSVDFPGLDAIAISEVRLRNDFLSLRARFRNEDTTVYIFTPRGRRLPSILVAHDEFRFSDYVPALKGTALDDMGRIENAMFLYAPKDGAADKDPSGSLTLSDLPAPVITKFSIGHGGSGARIDLKPGLNFFGHLDLKAPGAAKTLLQKVGLDGAKHPGLPLSGTIDPAILRPAKEQAKQIVVQIIESIDIAAPLPELKLSRLPGGMDFKNAMFSLKGEKDPQQPDHPLVHVGVRGDMELTLGGTRLDLTGGLEVDKATGSAAKGVKFTASARQSWDHPFGLNWLSLKDIRLEADFDEGADKSKHLDFKIAATASISRKPPVRAEGELVVAAGKLEDLVLRMTGLSIADLVPGSLDLPGLEAIAISEVRLRSEFLSVKARFRNEDTTVYVFETKNKKTHNVLVVHDEFKFSDYLPALKGTPFDDLGRVENAMFLYVPRDPAAGKGAPHSLALSDLPTPVIPKFLSGHGDARTTIDLKDGLNFFGHLDLQAPGTVRTLLQKVGLDGLKDPRLPLRGALDPAILKPAKEQAKQIVIQIIESIDIAAPLPELKLPRFPGGMDFKNAVLSLKGGKQPGQPDHPRVDIGIKGDIELAIHGTRLDLTGGLEVDKEVGGAAVGVKFAAAAKHDWDHPLGLSWLSLKGLGIAADFEESPDKSKGLDFKIDVAASINKKPPISAEGELIVADGKVQDVIFRLPGRVDVKDLPHIGSLPGVDQFSFANLAISTRELAGDLTWKPKNITQRAAVYFGGADRDQVALFYSLEKFSFGKLIPKLAGTEVGKIELPEFVLTLSNHDIAQTSIGQMPPEVQRILAGISKDRAYRMDVAKGVGMFAPLDPRSLGGELKAALAKLKINEPVVLGGSVGGILSGAPHLNLKASMPRVPVPSNVPKFLRFAKDVGGAFYLSYGGEVVDLGVEADVDMVLGLADRKPKLVTLQLGVELGGSGGVGLRTTGSVKGTWHDAMGMIGLDLEEATFKLGIDADTAVEIGMKAKETIGGDRIDYDILVAAIPEALTPTKLAVAFDAQDFGLNTYLAIGDVYLKTALAQPFFAALLEATLKKLGDKKAAASVDWYEQKIRSAPTLDELLPVNKLPTFHFKNVKVKLVMPGSGDPQLDLDPGVALAGQLWFGGKELGQVDTQLTFTGLKAAGDLAIKEIGPLRIDRAKLDIDASLGLDPHFKILADTRLLGTRQDLEIVVDRKGFRFDKVDDLGELGKLTWAAKTEGTDLLHLADFTVDGAFSSHFGEWLAARVAAELRPGAKGLEQIASDVATAQQALEHIKALAAVRRDAFKSAERALDAVNAKVERLPGGERAVEFEKWLLGELATARDRVADAERALIKDSEILAYEAAYDAARKAQSSVLNMLGSFVVNSATVHGSLRDATQGKPVRLHLDASVSGHRFVVDADVPLARPRDLDISSLVQGAYHAIRSELFGKRT